MKKPCIQDMVYQRTYPKPKPGDPPSFIAHVQKHVVMEVRLFVQMYYGGLDTLESQYPGIDYTYPPDRRRMSRYQWHRRLFRVFDELSLTDDEILNLCQWEGTRAAKERYEREAHTKIRVTTADDVLPAPRGNGPRAVFEDWSKEPSEVHVRAKEPAQKVISRGSATEIQNSDDGTEGDLSQFVADDFMELLRETVQARVRGEPAVINEAWEQWLKEAMDRHDVDVDSIVAALSTVESAADSQREEDSESLHDEPSREATPTLSHIERARPHSYLGMLEQLHASHARYRRSSAALMEQLRQIDAETARS